MFQVALGIALGLAAIGIALWWALRPNLRYPGEASRLAPPSGDDPDRQPVAGMGPD
jgi:hypothetical protein